VVPTISVFSQLEFHRFVLSEFLLSVVAFSFHWHGIYMNGTSATFNRLDD
jgi:hypothetical protein